MIPVHNSLMGLATSSIPLHDILFRLGWALIAGLVLGFERESHGRAAGLRTTILVSAASALAMILSGHLFADSTVGSPTWRPDPARLAAGILTGIGFLGAGSIIRQENVVRGVTTAAVLWFVTVLGLAFGSGYFLLGICGMGVAVFTLFILPYVESRVKNDWYATVTVTMGLDSLKDGEIQERIEKSGVKVKAVDLEYDLQLKQKFLSFEVKFKKTDLLKLSGKVVDGLLQCPGVSRVTWN